MIPSNLEVLGPKSNLQKVNTALDYRVCGAVGEFVPRICCANLVARKHVLDIIDLAEQLSSVEGAPVKSLRANSDGIDLVWILGNVLGESCFIGVER